MSHTMKSREARRRLDEARGLAKEQASRERADGYALYARGHALSSSNNGITHDEDGYVSWTPIHLGPSRMHDSHGHLCANSRDLSPRQMVRLAKALLAGSVGIWDVHADDMGIMDALRKAEGVHETGTHRQLRASSGIQVLDAEFEEGD